MPDIYIIAGPNGAGKTTAAYNLLPGVFNTIEFVNADEVARAYRRLISKRNIPGGQNYDRPVKPISERK